MRLAVRENLKNEGDREHAHAGDEPADEHGARAGHGGDVLRKREDSGAHRGTDDERDERPQRHRVRARRFGEIGSGHWLKIPLQAGVCATAAKVQRTGDLYSLLMTVLLLDPRWPTLIPMEAVGKLQGPVVFTDEVPVKVRWDFDSLLCGEDPEGHGVVVSTDPSHPQVRALIDADADLILAPSLEEPMWKAREVMSRARRIGEWERDQTHETLLPYLEEESAEFAQAVRERATDSELLKELGDVFLQVLFHAEIAARRGAFTLDDVAMSFVNKMRSRAPYLFDGTEDVVGVEEQERLWAEGKAREKN